MENINLSEEDGWTTVTFYVTAPSENVSGVQLRLGLGTYDAEDENKLLSGYAFFDTVTFREITSAPTLPRAATPPSTTIPKCRTTASTSTTSGG